VEKLINNEKIKKNDFPRLLTLTLKESLPEIHAAFREIGVDKLSLIFAKLVGRYSYDELRIARIMYQK